MPMLEGYELFLLIPTEKDQKKFGLMAQEFNWSLAIQLSIDIPLISHDIPLIVACTPQFATEIWSTGNSEACKTCTNVEDEPSRCDAVFASVF